MKLCQTQRGALDALFSTEFKLSLVLRRRCFDTKTDGLLLPFVSDVTPAVPNEGGPLLLHLLVGALNRSHSAFTDAVDAPFFFFAVELANLNDELDG